LGQLRMSRALDTCCKLVPAPRSAEALRGGEKAEAVAGLTVHGFW